jgi:hypothetical protein
VIANLSHLLPWTDFRINRSLVAIDPAVLQGWPIFTNLTIIIFIIIPSEKLVANLGNYWASFCAMRWNETKATNQCYSNRQVIETTYSWDDSSCSWHCYLSSLFLKHCEIPKRFYLLRVLREDFMYCCMYIVLYMHTYIASGKTGRKLLWTLWNPLRFSNFGDTDSVCIYNILQHHNASICAYAYVLHKYWDILYLAEA